MKRVAGIYIYTSSGFPMGTTPYSPPIAVRRERRKTKQRYNNRVKRWASLVTLRTRSDRKH